MTETPTTEESTESKTIESKALEAASVPESDADAETTNSIASSNQDASTAIETSSKSIGYDSSADGPDVRRLLAWGGLGVCSLVSLVAFVGFYSSIGTIIDLWIEPRHQPIVRAAFNLSVVLVALAGVSRTVRELS